MAYQALVATVRPMRTPLFGRRYVRAASLFAGVADTLPEHAPITRPQLALRDLQLLDGAFAEAARWAGVPVTGPDTTGLRHR